VAIRGRRRFSEAISEGDGISLVAAVDAPDAVRAAEAAGAEAVLVLVGGERLLPELRGATSLPILCVFNGQPADSLAGADACVVEFTEDEWRWERMRVELEDAYELVVRIRDEDELQATLDAVDPEVLLLAAPADDPERALERALALLADVPAGKLAVVDLPGVTRDDVAELERAGVDGVIVPGRAVADLAGAAAGER
jgi:methylmalonyl-CoA mutase cobalamin-binding subunit